MPETRRPRTDARPADPPIRPIRNRVLREDALENLRESILERRLPPGYRLVEGEVAESLGVSRAPVREALRQLQQEGLVQILPRRSAVVIGLPDDELEGVYELRTHIEVMAFRRACGRASTADHARLQAVIDRMGIARTGRDLKALSLGDVEFHGLLVEIAGLTFLRNVWSSLAGLVRIRTYQAVADRSGASTFFIENAVASHQMLLDLLIQGDTVRGTGALSDHILGVARRIAEHSG